MISVTSLLKSGKKKNYQGVFLDHISFFSMCLFILGHLAVVNDEEEAAGFLTLLDDAPKWAQGLGSSAYLGAYAGEFQVSKESVVLSHYGIEV